MRSFKPEVVIKIRGQLPYLLSMNSNWEVFEGKHFMGLVVLEYGHVE